MESLSIEASVIELYEKLYNDVPASRVRYAEIVMGGMVYAVICNYGLVTKNEVDYIIYDRNEFYSKLIDKITTIIAPKFASYSDGDYSTQVKLIEGIFKVDFYLKKDNREAIVIKSVFY